MIYDIQMREGILEIPNLDHILWGGGGARLYRSFVSRAFCMYIHSQTLCSTVIIN
jgi:hypothetical protein